MRLVFLCLLLVNVGQYYYAHGAIIEPTFTDSQKAEITEYVNVYRRKHSAPDVAWSDSIMNAISQPWAVHLATDTSVTMEHTSASSTPSGTGYGENLAWFQGYSNDVMDRMKDSVDAWYNEIVDMDWTDVEPTGAHTGVVGHFTCLIWVDQQEIGFGYAYNDATNEINVNQNTQAVCNVIGSFAENVLPLVETSGTYTSSSTNNIGAVFGIIFGSIIFFFLVWCQFPFLMDEIDKRPHVATEEEKFGSRKSYKAGSDEDPGDIKIMGATGLSSLFTCSEWCVIQAVATRDCFVWYTRASLGGENACCEVLHEERDPESGGDSDVSGGQVSSHDPDADTHTASGTGEKTGGASCGSKIMECCSLWTRATRACLCECWKEANEEIDHHEERKVGHSWCARFCSSFCACWTFYGNSLLQTGLVIYKYTRRCCIASHKALTTPKDKEEEGNKASVAGASM